MHKYVHIRAGAFGGQERVLDPLESQGVMSWLTCVLGTGLGSSGTEAGIFNCGDISPGPLSSPPH